MKEVWIKPNIIILSTQSTNVTCPVTSGNPKDHLGDDGDLSGCS